MMVRILREACCSQDDQIGPLEIQLKMDGNATLEDLITEMLQLRFLQYSASHRHMIGSVGDQIIVEIRLPENEIIFHVLKESLVRNLINQSVLNFSFINDDV